MSDLKVRSGRRSWWAWGGGAMVLALASFGLWRSQGAPGARWADIELAIAEQRWNDAEGQLVRWTSRRPGDDMAWLRLGGVLTMQGRLEEALGAYGRVQGALAARARAQTLIGEVRIKQHEAAAAERAFWAAVELRPSDSEPWRRLAYLLMLELRTDEARGVLWRLYRITKDPRHLLTVTGLAVTQPDARDPSPELDQYRKQIAGDPILERAQGLRLLRLGQPAQARPYLEAAVPTFEDDLTGRLALAECRILMDEPEQIDAILGPQPSRPGDLGQWSLLRGQAAEARDRTDAAIECWQNAVAADPQNRAAHYRLGQALVRKGAADRAKPHLEGAEVIRLREVSLTLAMDRFLRGARDAESLERLATLCRDLAMIAEARAWFEQVIQLDPTRSSSQAAMSQLAGAPEPPATPRLLSRARSTLPKLGVASAGEEPVRFHFEDIAATAGLDFRYDSGAAGNLFIADMMGGGVGLIDFDDDGWLDVYVVNGCRLPVDLKDPATPNRLFRNRGDGSFEDVTERAGVAGRGYGMGCTVGDFDNDGHDDLFVTGLGSTVLYRNRGDGTFEDVTERAGVGSSRWTTAAGFGDLDGDGDLDLFVVTYVDADPRRVDPCQDSFGHPIHCPPGHYTPADDLLLRNNGDGTFTDVSRAAGIAVPNGVGLGLAIADFDGDERLDVFVANDAAPNFLFKNLGGLRFEEVGVAAGVAYDGNGKATASMGVVADDLDGDGHIDLFHTNFVNESSTFLRNLGRGQFADATAQAGLAAATRPMTGFGTVTLDVDNDGWPDLFQTNGHVDDRPWDNRPMAQLPQLFVNQGEGRFVLASDKTAPYFGRPVVGRGAAAGDLDNDGRVDLLVVHRDAPLAVLHNVTQAGHWLSVCLRGTTSTRTPVGSRVICQSGGRTTVRWLTSGTSYLAQSDPRLWFGLGRAQRVDQLKVHWPSGLVQSWSNLPVDRILIIKEGEDPVELPAHSPRSPRSSIQPVPQSRLLRFQSLRALPAERSECD